MNHRLNVPRFHKSPFPAVLMTALLAVTFQGAIPAEAQKTNQEKPDKLLIVGQDAEREGKEDVAFDAYNRAIAKNPGYGYVYFRRGNIYLRRKDYDHAFEDYTCAIRYLPELEAGRPRRVRRPLDSEGALAKRRDVQLCPWSLRGEERHHCDHNECKPRREESRGDGDDGDRSKRNTEPV